MKPRKKQFTLVEILAVVGIILVLAGMSLGVYQYVQRASAEAKCKADIKRFEIALESYKAKTGYYPQQFDAYIFFMDMPWQAGVWDPNGNNTKDPEEITLNDFLEIKPTELKNTGTYAGRGSGAWIDPWQRPYAYVCPGKRNTSKFDFLSAGPDKMFGTLPDNSASDGDSTKAADNIANYDF